MELLDARELYRFYHAGDDETFALRGVSLAVAAGEMVAVIGPSGSGKSTLLACLAGLDEPEGGTVYVAGEQMTRRPERARGALRARAIGMLFQSSNLIEHLTVQQNVTLARRLARGGGANRSSLLDDLGLAKRASACVGQLSGGEAARAGLAVALANDPAVLLADEPTGELDHATASGVVDAMRSHAAGGRAVVVVTHDDRVAATADRTVHLVDGRVEP